MKKLIPLLILVFSLANTYTVQAQVKTISGTVTAESDRDPLPGVSIVVQGTTIGAQTNFDGEYTIEASLGDVLVFSYMGMKTAQITIADLTTINVTLIDDAQSLDEVMITALGIKKTRKSITYAAQDIKADELNRVKQTNPINSLSGKVSGLTVSRSSSGAGGSVKVLLRGNNSLGNNQPLYVIDGIPLSNPTASQPSKTFGEINGGNRDGGDALSLLNPDDIESLTVLKGASASALYGSAGLNGVILITTKKGKAGSFKVNVSSNLTVENAAYMMDFNKEAKNNIHSFFNNGTTNINTVSLSGGTETAQTYFSYSNSFSSGILPTNKLKQHTFNLRESAQFFDGKATANASVLLSTQKINNRPISGLYFNPLVGAFNFDSTSEKLADYKNFEELDPNRNIQSQRWFRGTSDIEQNPYWILNRNPSEDTNNKLLASLDLNLKVNDWLSLQTRGTYDKSQLDFERKIYATTEGTLAPPTGRYIVDQQDITQIYGDVIANINTTFSNNISLSAIVGASTNSTSTKAFNADSGINGGLQFANLFAFQNFNGGAQVSVSQNSYNKQVNSVFASTTIGFNESIFVDLTARNDWSSTLPASNNSFFYPSIGVTGVLSELFDLGEKVSFAKFRTSYAEVGNDFNVDQINPNRAVLFGGGGLASENPIKPFPGTNPVPEKQRSFEIGTEWKFYDNRFGIDIGYYKTSTINQYFLVPVSAALFGVDKAGLNSGDIINQGFEGTLFATPVQNDNFKWTTLVNFATNKNEILKISEENLLEGLLPIDHHTVSDKGVNTFASYLVTGGEFGDIYGQVVKKDANGTPMVNIDDNGAVSLIINDTNPENTIEGLEKVGNANPDFTIGWSNSFEYKNFTLDFLIDGRFGGETMSLSEAIVEGLSNNTARETSNGTVNVIDQNGTATTVSAQKYYGAAGGRNGFTGEYVYSATNVRLAEISLGYNFKMPENSFFTSARASLIGSNLFFFYKDAPHDPNLTLSTGNSLQGVDVLGLPSTRSTGLNIQLTF
tara:strand:+ start:221 stop:3259 length:3039 start_codon:yes stop_codon:yes gene_type:complete